MVKDTKVLPVSGFNEMQSMPQSSLSPVIARKSSKARRNNPHPPVIARKDFRPSDAISSPRTIGIPLTIAPQLFCHCEECRKARRSNLSLRVQLEVPYDWSPGAADCHVASLLAMTTLGETVLQGPQIASDADASWQ